MAGGLPAVPDARAGPPPACGGADLLPLAAALALNLVRALATALADAPGHYRWPFFGLIRRLLYAFRRLE